MSESDQTEQEASQKFPISVETFRKEEPILLEAKGSMTATRLAEKVAREEGSSLEEQKLEFEEQEVFDGQWGGMDLRRSKILATFGIVENSSIVQKEPAAAASESEESES